MAAVVSLPRYTVAIAYRSLYTNRYHVTVICILHEETEQTFIRMRKVWRLFYVFSILFCFTSVSFPLLIHWFLVLESYEKFEDIKGVIRCRISRKGRQYNGQKKKEMGTFCLTEQYQVPGSQLLNYFLSGNNSRKLLDTKNIWITTQQKAIEIWIRKYRLDIIQQYSNDTETII